MSTNTNKYNTNIHSRDFIVLPVTALDTNINIPFFEYEVLDVDGLPIGVSNYTINEYCQSNNRTLKYTTDGLYCFLGLNLSDLKNDKKSFKDFSKVNGIKLGGQDFTVMIGDEFWVLTVEELSEWLATSPHNVTVEEPLV